MVRQANCMEVREAIEDPKGVCIWDWDPDEQDQGEEGPPASASVQQETLQLPGIDDLIKSLDQPLTDEQAWMVAKLYRSHACMLEWQGQVSMLLDKLSTMVDHKTFLTIANTMVKPLHVSDHPPAGCYHKTVPTDPTKTCALQWADFSKDFARSDKT